MFNINYIKIPFPEAVETLFLFDGFAYSVSISGSYTQIPEANDSFDSYPTGGGQFTQLFFSGIGFWNGFGYTISESDYFYDDFNRYQTGLISGFGVTGNNLSGIIPDSSFLSGFFINGYNFNVSLTTGYTVWSGYN